MENILSYIFNHLDINGGIFRSYLNTESLSTVSFEYLIPDTYHTERNGSIIREWKGVKADVGGLFLRSYFSQNVEKLPSLRNRKSITPADSRRTAKLMALLGTRSPTKRHRLLRGGWGMDLRFL